jgi:G3E family GTPase
MFIPHQVAQRRLPVVLLTGFLGSGKTTLVNRLLSDPRLADTAVAINEFGEMPLDQLLIEHDADSTVVLANGCLCCRLAGDFEDAVMRVFTRRQTGALPQFARLIVEPSGLADPAPIAQAILRNPVMSGVLRLEAIIATVDAVLVEGQLARYPETRKQIALADRLVLTKTDMADTLAVESATRLMHELNPMAPILFAVRGAIDAATLLPAGFLTPDTPDAHHRSALFAELVQADTVAEHGTQTEAASLTADRPLDWRRFDAWLRAFRIGGHVLRVKGLLNVAGTPGPVVIQGVEHVIHAPIELENWPTADDRSRIVVISRGLPGGMIQQSWRQALPGLLATN